MDNLINQEILEPTIEGEGSAPEDEVSRLNRLLAEKTAEAESNHEAFLRTRADLDNARKRWLKEREDLTRYSALPLIKRLLPVVDDFDRALAAAHESSDFVALVKGVEMVERKLHDLLSQEGLVAIEALNCEFNPENHEALMVEYTDEIEDNIIIEVLQKGYMLHDKVIKPSLVKVAKKTSGQPQ
ncbi:MAG: nucleotide exchange factor GrpE [Methylocystaceae bacterium]